MGGKQKQAQRTKGNVKPSSSGRSAALLNTSFTGFSGGLKDSVFSSFNPASVTEEIDATIDPNFQLVLKKMNKKDPTTRVKALQEFIKLVESSDAEVLKAVLPFWPRLYCLLVGDVEHRVREAANDAQRSVIVQAKRNMAPYLRSVAGPWFVAQFDTYPPAASAASRAFQEAFPPNKLLEVIAFCQEEILKYISDNLLDQTDVKPDNSGRTEKQERVIITSLQGFCHFLKTVQDDLLTKPSFVQISENLLQSQQFWKFGIDKVPLVRSSWLSVITAILEKVPHLLKDHHQLLVKRILGRLDETDAVVIPYVWQTALSILVKLEDWSSYCDVNKQVFPRLWNILREGGYGCASTIFPNMLPLLNALLETKELNADKEIIVDTFFKSMREGFEKKSVQNSKSESEAVAQCYLECVRFIAKCGIEDTKLVLEHLMPVMEMTLTESSLKVLSKGIYENVSRLLRYWSSDKCISQYETVNKCFWDSSLEVFQKVLLEAENDSVNVYILNQEVQFCSFMKNPDKVKNKNVLKVRFSTEEDSVTSEPEKKICGEELRESETYTKYLNKFIMSLSLVFLRRINEHNDLCCVIPLAKLLSEHNSHELIEHLVLNCNVSDLFKTLSKKCFVTSGQNVEIVVELACSMIQHLEPAEREEILNTMCQEPDVLVCIFRVAQKEKVKPYILQWLRASSVKDQLIKLSQELCSESASSNTRDVLMECTKNASNGDFLVDLGTISSVMSALCNASCNMEMAKFAAQFLASFQASLSKLQNLQSLNQIEELANSTYRLVVVLFCLCCDKENANEDFEALLSNGWQSGVNILSRVRATDVALLVAEMSGIVRKNLLCSKILSIEEVEHLVEISMKLLNAAGSDDVEVLFLFTNGVLSSFELTEHCVTVHCENILMVLGAPACNLKIEHLLTSDTILEYVLLSLFTSKIVTKIIASGCALMHEKKENSSVVPPLDIENCSESFDSCVESQQEVTEMSPSVSYCESIVHEEKRDKIKSFDYISQRVLQLGMAISVCEIYNVFFKNMAFYNKTQMFINEFQDTFVKIKTSLYESGELSYIKESALEKASQHGGLWVPTTYLLSQEYEWLKVHKMLSCSRYSGYSVKILFRKALEVTREITIQSLGYSPGVVEMTYWLKYMKGDPDETIVPLILSFITKWRDTDRKELLYDCDVSAKSFTDVEKLVEKIYFLSACIKKYPHIMEQHIWDFIIVSAAYYAENLKYIQKFYFSEEMENILKVQSLQCEKLRNVFIFSYATFDLLNAVTQFCQNVKSKEQCEGINFEDRVNEWKNVFGKEVHKILASIFVSASGYSDKTKPSFLGHLFLQKYCSLMIKVNEESIDVEDSSEKLERNILTACCKLLHSPVSTLQFTAYHIFKKNLIHFVHNDANGLTNNQDMEESVSQQFEIYPLLEALQDTQTVVDTMLTDFSIGDSCIIQPHTDSYYYTAAYLLLWNLVLHACGLASSELRYQYATLLRNEGYLRSLLNNLFILMPSEVLETQPKAKTIALANMFAESPQLSLSTQCTSQQLQHMACWIYCWTVSRLPALVRQWWSDTRAKASAIVLKTTVQYVTPLLCTRDLQAIQNQNTKWKNMEVKVHPKARQVVAVYSVDESQMELIITLPEEYPLVTIQVDSHTSSLVGTSHWRYWVKQLSIFLSHQNGSLWDGLVLWKSNLDKRFEGVEECYICFSVLHGTNFQIPKLCCKTCKKKFHSPCLYKWFSTSNKSTCPICRNMF